MPLPLTVPLVLASQSPRRRELLATAGILFTVRVREVEETRAPGEPPDDYARRLARAKAEAAWEDRNEIVLGADTVVVLDQQVLEKPRDQADARAMLRFLSGREHNRHHRHLPAPSRGLLHRQHRHPRAFRAPHGRAGPHGNWTVRSTRRPLMAS